jgi:gas vesicle protein
MVRWQDLQDVIDNRGRQSGNTGSTIAAVTAGAALGLVAGLLLAPKSGRETRDQLLQKTKHSMDEGQEKIEEARDKVQEKADKVADTASQAVDREKEAVKEVQRRSNNSRGGR